MRNAQSRNRTSDTRIFSPLLYQLSYLGIFLVTESSMTPDNVDILSNVAGNVNHFFEIFEKLFFQIKFWVYRNPISGQFQIKVISLFQIVSGRISYHGKTLSSI